MWPPEEVREQLILRITTQSWRKHSHDTTSRQLWTHLEKSARNFRWRPRPLHRRESNLGWEFFINASRRFQAAFQKFWISLARAGFESEYESNEVSIEKALSEKQIETEVRFQDIDNHVWPNEKCKPVESSSVRCHSDSLWRRAFIISDGIKQ